MSDEKSGAAGAEQQLRAEVASLGQKFLRRTADQLAVVLELVTRLGAGEAGVLEPLQQLTHKIHGSGAIFGFARISEAAGSLEQACDQAAAAAQLPPAAQLMERLNKGVQELTAAVTAAASPPAPGG